MKTIIPMKRLLLLSALLASCNDSEDAVRDASPLSVAERARQARAARVEKPVEKEELRRAIEGFNATAPHLGRDVILHSHLSIAAARTASTLLALQIGEKLAATEITKETEELLRMALIDAEGCLAEKVSIMSYYDEVIRDPSSDPDRVVMMKSQKEGLDKNWSEVEAALERLQTALPEEDPLPAQ